MAGPWIGGLQVRRTERGQTPIADFLCTACRTYRRVTGRQKVADFVRSNPITDHRANCRPTKQKAAA
ncbi:MULTISPECIES: transcription factor WhiB [unclassified Streptomyces]|uniref:transcription factor WhiB n=1 Tax=unclassified Streptomyces TaxID=2593676 RepID=UPI0014895DA3|nr:MULTISPECIES: transcription factor WhiB [unclassified Streptomyces]